MVTAEHILKNKLFKDLSTEKLDEIVRGLESVSYTPGEIVIYRGDPGYSMFLILSGTVAVTLTNDEGYEYTIATLGEGEIFGEMALLTGEPRSADVKAVGDVEAIEIDQEKFNELIRKFPELNKTLFQLLVQRLGNRGLKEKELYPAETREIITSLLSAHNPPEWEMFPGKTKWAVEINETLMHLATGSGNILILGERGTERELAARLIHYNREGERPLLYMDCSHPPPIQRITDGRGTGRQDEFHREIAQEAALFGHCPNVASYARGKRIGYIELADQGTLILDKADALSPRVQLLLAGFLRDRTFSRIGEMHPLKSSVRVIATAEDSVPGDKIDGDLFEIFSKSVVRLKPLRERKKDIPVIAGHYLEKYNQAFGKEISRFSEDAMNALIDHAWPLNSEELGQVVERAVAIAGGDTIEAGQIFLEVPLFTTTGKFNLLKIPLLDRALRNPRFPKVLSAISVPVSLFLIIYALWGPRENNIGNLLVWAIWWPLMILSVGVSARSWCGYCPMPVIGNALAKFRNEFFPVPGILARNGAWTGIFGFAAIMILEYSFGMFHDPKSTGILLLSIFAGAVVTTIIFGKRSWCKHVCPLGAMVGFSSTISMMELGTNTNVCSNQCQTHDCVKDENCPMGIHPSAASFTRDCVLCLACLKSCPHRAVRVNARLPWQGMLARDKWEPSVAIFAIIFIGSVLALKIPAWEYSGLVFGERIDIFTGMAQPVRDMAFPLLIMVLVAALMLLCSGFPWTKRWKQNLFPACHAYLFLAFAGFLNIYLNEFVRNGHNLLPWIVAMCGLEKFITPAWVTPELRTLRMLIPLITLAGSFLSFLMLRALSRKNILSRGVFMAHQALMLVISVVLIVIL